MCDDIRWSSVITYPQGKWKKVRSKQSTFYPKQRKGIKGRLAISVIDGENGNNRMYVLSRVRTNRFSLYLHINAWLVAMTINNNNATKNMWSVRSDVTCTSSTLILCSNLSRLNFGVCVFSLHSQTAMLALVSSHSIIFFFALTLVCFRVPLKPVLLHKRTFLLFFSLFIFVVVVYFPMFRYVPYHDSKIVTDVEHTGECSHKFLIRLPYELFVSLHGLVYLPSPSIPFLFGKEHHTDTRKLFLLLWASRNQHSSGRFLACAANLFASSTLISKIKGGQAYFSSIVKQEHTNDSAVF